MTPRRRVKDRSDSEQGFVLPYVLVVIAILSIAGTIAAQRLTRAADMVSQMQMKADSELILQSAEAAVTYSLLTGNPIQGGYDLAPKSPIAWEFGLLSANGVTPLSADAAQSMESDFWAANGELRRYSLDSVDDTKDAARNSRASDKERSKKVAALVSLQDSSGLYSFAQAQPEMLEAILKAAGASPPQIRAMIDSLQDYTDVDNRRRNDGAEINDYRRAKMKAPPNSPLRNFQELSAVWGWEDALKDIDKAMLGDLTTVMNTPGYREKFARPYQQQIFGNVETNNLDIFSTNSLDNIGRGSNSVSGSARISIYVPRNDGQYDKRVLDIQRFLGGVDAPYRRRWVYDATVLESDFEKDKAPSDADRQTLDLNGLKHVVHTASSAR